MQNPEQLQRIRERAYALYVGRSGQEGSAVEDWLRAERELADTIRTTRPSYVQPVAAKHAQQSYGGDGMSSGPAPEVPDPATLEEAAPSVTSPRGINAEGRNRTNPKTDNSRRRH